MPRNKENHLMLSREWKRKNKERNAQKTKEWREKNKDRIREYMKAYAKTHPTAKSPETKEKMRIARKKRYEMQELSYCARTKIRKKLHEGQLGLCNICRKIIPLFGSHLDHIIPMSKGGIDAESNFQVLCPSCNSSKGDKILSHQVIPDIGNGD